MTVIDSGNADSGERAGGVDEIISNHHLFRSLDDAARAEVRAIGAAETFVADAVLIREGDAGDSFFIITSGKVEVTTAAKGHPIILGILKTGAFVGEVGSLSGKPRTATVRALTPVSVVRFERAKLMAVLARFPKATELLSAVALARAQDTISKISR
ncbi:MAG: cyclic nucleotide-binding domain-containing protein [Deltaproteobacteria bacterium]|nr:cyclic nucleotide-binding domain-containing protein [Deltaproteobacteria bacterium]